MRNFSCKKPLVSVIMPSYLEDYEGAAKDREEKFIRAVNSFLGSNYANKELIIISDGCEKTNKIYHELFNNYKEVDIIEHYKEPLFSGKLRTLGIRSAKGDIIMYLDSDDMFGEKHISSVAYEMVEQNLDWCYYNDHILNHGVLRKRQVELEHGSIGTSSIAHANIKGLDWEGCDGYGHDWKFINKMINMYLRYDKIYATMYIVAHIPNMVDS